MSISFKPFYHQVLERCGSEDSLADALPTIRPVNHLEILSDDRYLSAICLRVFRAGLKHSMVNNKWRIFDKVFYGFNTEKLASLSDEALEALMNQEGIIKHWTKVKAIRANANFVKEYSLIHGSFGHWLAVWPSQDIVGLWDELSKHGSQLGGLSGPSFLRYIGKDTFLLTSDVVAVLQEQGIIQGNNPLTKTNLAAVQAQFNEWHIETKLPYSHLSRIISMTVNQREEFI